MLADRVRMVNRNLEKFIPILYDNGKFADKWNPAVVNGTVDMIKKSSYLYSKNTVAGTFDAEWISTEKIDFAGFNNLNVEFENDKSFARQILTLEISNYQNPYYIRIHPRIGPPTVFPEELYIIISDVSTPGSPYQNVVASTALSNYSSARDDMLTFKIYKIWLS
jgi:hypothetical protein